MVRFSSPSQDLKRLGVFALVIIVFFFIGAMALTGGGGFSDADFTKSFIVYASFGVFGLLAISLLIIFNKFGTKKRWFVPLHNPEESVVGSFRVVKNPLLLACFTSLIFLPFFFFFARESQTFFSNVLFVPQAVNTFGGLVGESILPAINENLLMFIPIILLYTWSSRVLAKKGEGLWRLFNLFVIPLLRGFLWVFFHSIVYGNNEVAQISTFVFGVLWVVLTMITKSWVPGTVVHFLANFSLSAFRYDLIANEYFFVVIALVWVGLLVFSLGYSRWIKDRRGASV